MKIVIVGAGKVGSLLCEDLSNEGHDIILIEQDEDALNELIEKVDITGIIGNGASVDILEEVGMKDCDVFISVTQKDEINLLAAVIARQLGAQHSIVRVRSTEYNDHLGFMKDSFGITLMINPDHQAAFDIVQTLQYPSAYNVESFASNRVNIVEFVIDQNSVLKNQPLLSFRREYGNVLVCVILRDNEVIIPDGSYVIQEGDHIYVTGSQKDMRQFGLKIFENNRVKKVFIIGGGNITFYLCQYFERMKIHVKVIENNIKQAERLAQRFNNFEIILGDGTNQDVLMHQGLDHYDAMISLTGIDEENILISMFGHQNKVPRIITKVNRRDLLKIVGDKVGLQTIITPKSIVADHIMTVVRALFNSQGSNVEALYRFLDNRVEALQFRVSEHSKVINIPLKDLKSRPNILIAFIIRNNNLFFPGGNDEINAKDSVIIISKETLSDLDDILV